MQLLLYEFISQEFLGDAVRSSRRVFVRLPQLAGGELPASASDSHPLVRGRV